HVPIVLQNLIPRMVRRDNSKRPNLLRISLTANRDYSPSTVMQLFPTLPPIAPHYCSRCNNGRGLRSSPDKAQQTSQTASGMISRYGLERSPARKLLSE